MALAEGSTFAGYTIIRQLGAGGMGEVYLAQHPRLPRQDVLKILRTDVSADEEYRERFHREADTAASLWHPHVVAVHDRGETDGQLWIDMDYVDGTDAGELLREKYPEGMPGAMVTQIVTAVAEALDYAHENKLIHRDVKPANILIAHPESRDCRIMLADFGIAGLVGESTGLTATNMTVGTVSYAAPEQLMGEDLDGRADQYALAVSAFQLLTGAPPFQHSNAAVVISQHLSASPPAIGDRRPDLQPLDPVFAKALSKQPKDRYLRCIDFARALSHHLGTGEDLDGTRLSVPTAPPALSKQSLTRPSVIIAAVLSVLLVVAVVIALREFIRLGDEERAHDAPQATTTEDASAPPNAPATTEASSTPTDATTPVLPVVAIGAECAPLGAIGVTKNNATAYCSELEGSSSPIWSLTEGTVSSPTIVATPEPNETSLPSEEERPILVCMQQTGQTRRECREEILRSNPAP
ncbi:serine/threonine protein kinase [Mycobacterium intermedium]|uniref:non-specific serine/threonine protein kinase n=1 Tax=Mycobacterium intermedium TaxID=28445 RepID=A0A1E3SIU2_MYCIE|nr:serine/threonine-protein kinase [Mycobacterium intermedium]MCV6967231.1 protein kinase [Mycobacterium intermedium]ODR02049.1 serine/threonine protein kinase [Mycobacterium intermedium]OPE50218.1 serine/threonine protein kinase [Mycobacterium intermedium]ORB08996.1 serine/threonine protein kinase [Mycobacterium intermedium]